MDAFTSVLKPATKEAADILGSFYIVLAVAAFIFVIVAALVVYALIRFRRREGREPKQFSENIRLEVVWISIPLLIVIGLFIVAVRIMAQVNPPVLGNEPDLTVVFNKMGCLYCHTIEGHGGKRGPDLTWIADRLTRDQLILRIMNGAYNMPVFGRILSTAQTENLLDFLTTRKKSGSATGKQQSAVRPSGSPTQAAFYANEELSILK
jgi:amino acid transporter